MALFAKLLKEFESRHYGFIGKSFKPFPVLYPWAYPYLELAKRKLGLCYWQMPYEQACREFRGLPFKRWQAAVELNAVADSLDE